MPRFEIITTAQEVNRENPSQELFKTTMTHYLTGSQMADLLKVYRLLDWANYAKNLIKDRQFGVEQT